MEAEDRIEQILDSTSIDFVKCVEEHNIPGIFSFIQNKNSLWEDLPDLLCCVYGYTKHDDIVWYDFGDGFFLAYYMGEDEDTSGCIECMTPQEFGELLHIGLSFPNFEIQPSARLSDVLAIAKVHDPKNNKVHCLFLKAE